VFLAQSPNKIQRGFSRHHAMDDRSNHFFSRREMHGVPDSWQARRRGRRISA